MGTADIEETTQDEFVDDTNKTNGLSITSYQTGRSVKDKIMIIQDSEEPKDVVKQIKETINLTKIQTTIKDNIESIRSSTVNTWKDIEKNTSNTFEDVSMKSKKFMNGIGTNSKLLMEDKVKPGWNQTVYVVQAIPGNTRKSITKLKDNTVENTSKVITLMKDTIIQQYETHVHPKFVKVYEFHDSNSKYYIGKAPGIFENTDLTDIKYEISQLCLLSIGMVLNCESPLTGLIIWLAIFCTNPLVAISGLLSLLSAVALQRLIFFSSTDLAWNIRAGANIFIVGTMACALIDFPSTIFIQIISKLGLAVLLGPNCLLVHWQLFSSSKTPLLWSFNVTMGVVILAFSFWDNAWLTALAPPHDSEDLVVFSIFGSSMSSISAIFGITNPYSGLAMLIGVFLCSRILSAYLIVACAAANILGWFFGMPLMDVNVGIAGYQAGLAALACAYYFIPCKVLPIFCAQVVIWTCVVQTAIAEIFNMLIGKPVTLNIAFCLVIMPLLIHTDTAKFGLERVSEEVLSFPEEYTSLCKEDKNDIIKDDNDVEDQKDESDDKYVSTEEASENTPLISSSLKV